MKIKIFSGDPSGRLETEVNAFLATNPDFEVVSLTQTETFSDTTGFNLTLVLLYKEGQSNEASSVPLTGY